jgi:hypothetical protein
VRIRAAAGFDSSHTREASVPRVSAPGGDRAASPRGSIEGVQTWMWLLILGLGLIKLPMAALMLWLPFRSDAALHSFPTPEAESTPAEGEDDGGSKTLPGGDCGRWSRRPRNPFGGRRPRGPHGGAGGRPSLTHGRVRAPRHAARVGATRQR